MSAPSPKGTANRGEKIKGANASRIKKPEENLLDEFAELMGADVNAIRPADRAARGRQSGASQTSPPPVIAVDQFAKQRSTVHSFPSSIGAAASASTEKPSEFRGDVLPVLNAHPHDGGTFASVPSTRRRRLSRANVTLTALIMIGAGGFYGAWALNAAPGARTATPVDAADESAKVSPALREATSSVEPSEQGRKEDQVNLASPADPTSGLPSGSRSAATSSDSSEAGAPIVAASPAVALSTASADTPSVSTTAADQTADIAGTTRSLSDSKEDKVDLVRSVPNGSGSDSTRSLKPAEAPASPLPALPESVPVPHARPLSKASANSTRQPSAHKVVALSKSSSKSIDHPPTPKVRATMGSPSRPLDVATAPGDDVATAPEAAKAPHETTSTDSLLQFVPNLFNRGVSAVRSIMGGAATGGG
jgi:hypothetical protein